MRGVFFISLICTFIPTILYSQTISYSGSLNICLGQTKTLTIVDAPPGATFKWLKDDVEIIPTQTSISFNATTSGSYTALINNLITTPPIVLVVNTNPTASFTVSSQNDCANVNTTFTSTSTGSTLTYAWNFGDPNSGAGNTSTLQNPVKVFVGTPGNSTQTFSVSLTVTDVNGCTNTATNNIVKNQLPSTALGGTGIKIYNDQTYYAICGSTSGTFTFSNTSTTSSTNTNYNITWGNGNPNYSANTFTSTTQTYNTGVYTLNYSVTGGNGCVNTSEKKVFVGSNPSIGTSNPGSTSVCTGQTLTFPINDAINNTPGTTYTVNFHDGTAPSVFTHPAPANVSHTYLSNSCGINSLTYSNSFYVSIVASNACETSTGFAAPIYVSDAPIANFSISPSSPVCVNTVVNFTGNATSIKVASNSGCANSQSIWSITPSTGWVLQSGSVLGIDNGFNDPSLWTTPGSNNLSVRFTAAGTYTIKLKVANSTNCGFDEITKTICVNPTPTASFTVDQTTGCNNLLVKTTNTSSAPSCGVNTYSWSISYSAASGCTPSTSLFNYVTGSSTSQNPEFSFVNPGTYTISLVVTSPGGCVSAATTRTITVKSRPTVTLNSIPTSTCVGSISPSATVANCNATTTPTYSWTFTGGSQASSTSASPGSISYATPGTYTIQLDVTNECGTTTVTRSIEIRPIPNATVPANQEICTGTTVGSFTFTGNVTGTTFAWTNNLTSIGLASSGNTATINAFTAVNNSSSPVVSTISVTPSAGGCAGPPNSFTITVNPRPPAPGVTSPVAYCLNATPSTLTASTVPGNTVLWYNNIELTGGSTTAPTPSTAVAGTTTYYVTQTDAFTCRSNSSTITVNVTNAISNNTITADQTICAGTNPTSLTGTPTGGTGSFIYQWEFSTNGGASWSNVTSGGTSLSYNPGLISTTTTYRRQVSSGACNSTSNSITITVVPSLANTGIGSPQTICQGSPVALLTGQLPTGGNGSYSYQWESSNNNSTWSTILGATLQDYQPTAINSTTYFRRRVTSGVCNVVSSSVAVVVTPALSNNTISSDQTICIGSSANTITGTSVVGGSGTLTYQWQLSTDNGTSWVNVPLNGNNSSYNPGAISASTSYRRIVSSGACTLISGNTITITVLPALTNFSISTDQQICEGNPTALLVGQLPTGGNGSYTYQWESSTNNSTWNTITGTNTKDYQPPVLTTTTYYRRRVTSGACSVLSPTVTITIYNNPNAGTLSASVINVCQGATVSISTSGVIGVIQKWQYNLTPADNNTWIDVIQTSNTVSFTNVQNSFGVRVVVKQSGSCTNEAISAVTQVNTSPTTVAGVTSGNATVCITGNSGTINLSGQTGSVIRWEGSTNNGSSWTTVNNTTTSLNYLNLTTTTLYRAVVQSGVCPQVNSTASTITVVPAVTPSNAGIDQRLCNQTQVTLNGNAPSFGTGVWSQVSGSTVTITNPSLRNTTITGLQPGQTYRFSWVINGPGACPSSSDDVEIVNTPAITTANAGSDKIVCAFTSGNDSVSLSGNSLLNPTFETGTWTLLNPVPTGSSSTIRNSNSPTSVFVFNRSGTYRLVWSISNNACATTRDTTEVIVFDKPITGPLVASASKACVGNDILIAAGNSFRGVVSKWQYSFNPTISSNWIDTAVTSTTINFLNVQKSFSARIISVSAGISRGCTISDTSTIPIEIVPDFNNIIDTTSLTVCPGQAVAIAGQLPIGAYNVFDYQWQQSKDGKTDWVDIPGQTGANLNMTPLSTIFVRRLVIVSPCIKASSLVYIFVRPSVGNFLMSDSVGTCFPFDVTFTNLVLPSTKTTWNFGDGAFNEGDEVSHTYRSTGTFQVVMTAQYPGGCRFEATKTVTITGPKGIFQHNLTPICLSDAARFEVASPGIDSIRWNFGDGNVLVSTEKIVYHKYAAAGPYFPTVDLLAGPEGKCRSRLNGIDSIRVDNVTGGFTNTIEQACGNTIVAFTDRSTAFYGVKSIQWDFGDGNSSNNRNPIHTYNAPSIWQVRQITEGNSGCKDTIRRSIPITIWDIPKVNTNKDSIACVGQVVPFAANVFSLDPIKSTVWNFSSGSTVTTLNAPTIYHFPGNYLTVFVATTIHNCSDTVRLPIRVFPSLSIDLGPDKLLPTGTLLPLNSIITNGPVAEWEWKPNTNINCSICPLPIATIKNNITYTVKGTTANGCIATDSLNIKVFCESAQVFIPNVFTPDGDGLNDILMVRASGIRSVKSFRIFNRWGGVVFEKSNFQPNDKSQGWNGLIKGVKADPDVYVYTCEVICENNTTYTYKGNITLVK